MLLSNQYWSWDIQINEILKYIHWSKRHVILRKILWFSSIWILKNNFQSGQGNPLPWTEEPGWLQSMGSQRIRHHWTTNTRCSTGSCFCRDTVPPQFSLFYRRWQESRNSIKEYPGKYRFHIISEFTNHKFLLINFDNLSSSNTDSLQLNNNAQSTIIIVSCAKKNMYICL